MTSYDDMTELTCLGDNIECKIGKLLIATIEIIFLNNHMDESIAS